MFPLLCCLMMCKWGECSIYFTPLLEFTTHWDSPPFTHHIYKELITLCIFCTYLSYHYDTNMGVSGIEPAKIVSRLSCYHYTTPPIPTHTIIYKYICKCGRHLITPSLR